MDLLSRFLSECVIFLVQNHGLLSYQVAAQGLEKEMQISREQLEKELNSGWFFRRIVRKDRTKIIRLGAEAIRNKENFTASFNMIMKDGQQKSFFLKSDFVDDETGDVKCIFSIRRE